MNGKGNDNYSFPFSCGGYIWLVKETGQKKLFRIILSFITGFAGAAAAFFVLIFIFLSVGLFGWSDGGEKEELKRLEQSTNITLAVSVVTAFSAGIYIIYRMNKPKEQENDPSPPDILSQ